MKVIGLTGGIASGKSTVSRVLEKQGAKIIDADIIARDIVQPGCPALAEIVKVFGKETLLPDGRLDRVYLGQKVFQNQSLRKVLNSITHPKIREQIIEELRKIERESPEAIAVVDAPLLIEAGLVEIDGVKAVIGDKVTKSNLVTYKKKPVKREEKLALIAFNKPMLPI